MKTLTVDIRRSKAIEEWMMKEEGSYEDNKRSPDHVFAILKTFRGKVTLTEEQAASVIKSGNYHSTAWNDDEIVGGARTKKAIAAICVKIEAALPFALPTKMQLTGKAKKEQDRIRKFGYGV